MTSGALKDVCVHVVMLNWNGLADTCECLDSLLVSEGVEFSVSVIDNGSEGNDAAELNERYGALGRVNVEANGDNLGFARGMNVAVEKILAEHSPDYVVLLNNDTVVEKSWLIELVQAVEEQGAAIGASRMVNYFHRDQLDNAGHLWLNTGEVLPRGTADGVDSHMEPAWLVGACAGAAIYRSDVIRQLGLFDEHFSTGYEDAEHGLRAFLCGYPTLYVPSAVVYHKVSQSLDKVRDFDYSVSIQRNIHYTLAKLMPGGALVLNAPFILAKLIAIPLIALLAMRWTLLRAHLRADRHLVRDFIKGWRARAGWRANRKVSAWTALKAQKFFALTYLGYFRRYILAGKPTVFER